VCSGHELSPPTAAPSGCCCLALPAPVRGAPVSNRGSVVTCRTRVLQRCAAAACVHVPRACCVCIGRMPVGHGAFACGPAQTNGILCRGPPSTQQRTPTWGTSCAGRCWSGERGLAHCAADRLKARRCLAESPNWHRAAQRPAS
jgi:hypothetical protein